MRWESLLLLLTFVAPACSKSEVEEKAKEQLAAQAIEHSLGGSASAGELCADWPKNVPIYPGAKIIVCQSKESNASLAGQQAADALAKREGKEAGVIPNVSKVLILGTEVKATSDEVVAFYKKSLPGYETASTNGMANMAAITELANKKDASDPVSAVVLMPMSPGSESGTVKSQIMVTLKRN